MITGESLKEDTAVESMGCNKIRCGTCSREVKSSSEWIRTGDGIMCETCYHNLLLPNMKISFDD